MLTLLIYNFKKKKINVKTRFHNIIIYLLFLEKIKEIK